MIYFSTRDRERKHPFTLYDAAFRGLAPDGGLFIMESYPQVDMSRVEELADISFADMASYIAQTIFGDDIDKKDIDTLVHDAYDFELPLYEISEEYRTLQLFHGPTFAFKDFGGRFMGRMLGLMNRGGDPIIVLTATSGDTGSAVAHGFWKVPGVKVVILYPDGKVSDFQEAQMTTLGGNIYPLRVKGTFDDCQHIVKALFSDKDFRSRVRITSANSINVLRWIPQSFYYFYGYHQWHKNHSEAPDIVVPSGNYGNITAGILAQRMGMPAARFIAGANANDVVPEFLTTGQYHPRPSVKTVANAMDVGAPSNFERLMALYDYDEARVRTSVEGFSYSDRQIREGIKHLYDRFAYISDPHSAIGYLAYRDSAANGFWLSTAHSAKFPQVITESTGIQPERPDAFRHIEALPRHFEPMDASTEKIENYICTFISNQTTNA